MRARPILRPLTATRRGTQPGRPVRPEPPEAPGFAAEQVVARSPPAHRRARARALARQLGRSAGRPGVVAVARRSVLVVVKGPPLVVGARAAAVTGRHAGAPG